jgi:hypothetical protein
MKRRAKTVGMASQRVQWMAGNPSRIDHRPPPNRISQIIDKSAQAACATKAMEKARRLLASSAASEATPVAKKDRTPGGPHVQLRTLPSESAVTPRESG